MSSPENSVGMSAQFDVAAPMRDGTLLRANIFRPDGPGAAPGPWPVLLTRLPYGKDLPLGALLDPMRATRLGFMVVVQDVRGRYTSGGDWYPFIHEAEDGYDTVEWAANLPGSNGMVGMYGASYFGFTQWAAARLAPPHLKALAPMITWDDPLDGLIWRGGALEWGLALDWTLRTLGYDVLARRQYDSREAFGGTLMAWIATADALATSGVASLPLRDCPPLQRFGMSGLVGDALASRLDRTHPTISALSVVGTYDRISTPSLNIGGWYDIFLAGTIANFQKMRREGASAEARQSRLLIGPWTHGGLNHVVGDIDFGMAASGIFVGLRGDLIGLTLSWFDAFLGSPAGPERARLNPALANDDKPITIFVMGANVWRDEAEWPLARAITTPYYLHSGGHACTSSGDGMLSPTLPGDEPADEYTYDPNDPVPTIGGPTLMGPSFRPGPLDQNIIEKRSDMLVYTSTPVEQPLEVTGPILAHLWVSSSAPDADVVVRLVDVHPSGFAQNVTDGIQRLRYRHGPNPEFLMPGTPYQVTVDLWATSIVFGVGHRLRVDITAGSFPRWDRNPQTDEPIGESTALHAARHIIWHDDAHRSCIELPVIPTS